MKRAFWKYLVPSYPLSSPPSLPPFLFFPPRSVYDGQEHGLFMEKLDVRIRNHDREIEKMCNHHFQGFVDSITELLKVRGEAQKLKVRGGRVEVVDQNSWMWSWRRALLSLVLLLPQSQVTETNGRLQDDGKEVRREMSRTS